jgi:hypothetical protein
VPLNEDVSHGDIYHKLGSLEGKVETLILQASDRRTEISSLFSRIRTVEMRIAWGVGAIALLTFIGPVFLEFLQVQQGYQQSSHSSTSHR